MNPFLEAALYYVEHLKWSVIPLSPGSKIPPKGFSVIPYRDRVASKEEIEGWWKENPKYNIGIVTGKLSNLFVVDHDKYKPEYSDEEALKYIPDHIITPTVQSPQGGEHQYFQFVGAEGLTIKAGFAPAMDFRGDGGYIVAPPSVNGTGRGYLWMDGLSIDSVEIAALPLSFINNSINSIYRDVTNFQNQENNGVLQSVTINLNKGTRDDSLFHVAHTMMKGGATWQDTEFILNLIALQCKPPYPKEDVKTKIESVLNRAKRKERNIAREVESYIAVTFGAFSVTSCYMELQAVTKEERTSVRVHLYRLVKQGILERYGDKDGMYRKINKDLEFIKIDGEETDEEPYPVKLPLGIRDLIEVCEGDIILVGGEYNAGKTTFILNVLQENKNLLPIRYQSSEMNAKAFKRRFRGFGLPMSFWLDDNMTEYIKRNCDFSSAIAPDSLNIIDYLEFKDSDYTKGAEILTNIHEKLGKGIAVIAVQKKEGQRLPRSGDLILEKPRFAMTMTKVPGEREIGIAEVLKAKDVKLGKCDGKKLRYEIKDLGSRFRILNDWGWWK